MRNLRGVFFFLFVAAMAMAVSGCPRRQPPGPAAGPACPPEPETYTTVPAAAVSPIPVWRPIAGKTVVLDAGHGGNDFGAAHFGLREKDINLDLAARVAAGLRGKGVVVHMTRDKDVFVPLPDRSAFANRYPNAVLVSIHVNASASNPNAGGVETFILSKDLSDAERGKTAARKFKMGGSDSVQGKQALANLAVRSRNRAPALAGAIQKSLAGRLGEIDRGVKPGNLAVLRETYFCPAVLVEVGFLTNARTAAAMGTEDWRRRAADGIAEGIAEFLRLPDL